MKHLALISLVFIASCASRPQLAVRPLPSPPVNPVESVRYGEVIRAYHVGRYVDPNHPEVMEEQHAVYRIEVSARWNLHPGPVEPHHLLNPPPDAAFASPPTNNAIIAELNRQRKTTTLVLQQAARLAQSYNELQGIFAAMKNVARENLILGVRMARTEQQVLVLGKELEKITATPSPTTNEAPAFSSEPNDSLKP